MPVQAFLRQSPIPLRRPMRNPLPRPAERLFVVSAVSVIQAERLTLEHGFALLLLGFDHVLVEQIPLPKLLVSELLGHCR